MFSQGLKRRKFGDSSPCSIDQDGRPLASTSSPTQLHSSYLNPVNKSGERNHFIRHSGQSNHKQSHDVDYGEDPHQHPRLTLMEECLLVGFKDQMGNLPSGNDDLSYTLRGCILIELALRGRIAVRSDLSRKPLPIQDSILQVVNSQGTGEPLLDEALELMEDSKGMSVREWVDLLSGETWNVLKTGYQIREVRGRLKDGLVEKGILGIEKRSYLLIETDWHPIRNLSAKNAILNKILGILISSTSQIVQSKKLGPEEDLSETLSFGTTRTVCLLICSLCGDVLENALVHLDSKSRRLAFKKANEISKVFSQWPLPLNSNAILKNLESRTGLVEKTLGSLRCPNGLEIKEKKQSSAGVNVDELVKLVQNEMVEQGNERQFQCICAVLNVLSRFKSLV